MGGGEGRGERWGWLSWEVGEIVWVGGGEISARGGGMDCGGVGVVMWGGGGKSIFWGVFGAWVRFWVMGGVDIPENLFCRCTPIKTAF